MSFLIIYSEREKCGKFLIRVFSFTKILTSKIPVITTSKRFINQKV